MALSSVKPMKIALVDDQNIVREAFAGLLEESGIAEVVGSYQQTDLAPDELRRKEVGAIIVGFEAQINDPLHTVSWLAKSLPGVPICALVGGGQPALVQNALNAGCSCAVSTASSVEVLGAALRSLALGQAWVDPNLGGRLLVAEYGARDHNGHKHK